MIGGLFDGLLDSGMQRSTLGLLFGYVAALALTVWGMSEARSRTLASLDNAQSNAEWQSWREETIRQSKEVGPVKRRPAKAQEPPMLILLRDHFAAATVTTMLAVTIFYWFFGLVIRGSAQSKQYGERAASEVTKPGAVS
ncbi:MAG: hypothetical protein C0483_13480 [Pirellula sp.]|nr:hypothetical protein [Pirellula sp.]